MNKIKDILWAGKSLFLFNLGIFLLSLFGFIWFHLTGFIYIIAFILLFTLFCAVFLRIPTRKFKSASYTIYSSADGYVLDVQENIIPPDFFNEPVHKVVVFMHVGNVHWNYSPIKGQIDYLAYKKGSLRPVFNSEAWENNEHLAIGIHDKENKIKVLMVMVAGLIARRIKFLKEKSLFIQQCERIGLIQFGSANILYFPATTKLLVVKKQKVRAGITPIAKIIK